MNEDKRIIELTATSELDATDFLPIDNSKDEDEENSGTRKIRVSTLLENTVKVMVTQAEYDALPSSKLTDGKVYYITDESKIIINGVIYGAGGETVADVYVNGTSVVDNNSIAQIKSYKEVTQAEYDALPSSKLTDNILYCIKDSGADIVNDVQINGTSIVEDGVADITVDSTPTNNSGNPVSSGGVATALANVSSQINTINGHLISIGNALCYDWYDSTQTYNKGDYVWKESSSLSYLYRCLETTTGTWDEDAWEEVTVASELKAVKEDVAEIEAVKEEVEEIQEKESSWTMVGSASGSIATFKDGANLPMPTLKIGINAVQSGSGDPSPSNIRPISGFTEGNVSVSGTNVWDEEWQIGDIDGNTGVIKTGNYLISKNYIKVFPNTSYYIKTPTYLYLYKYDVNKNVLGYQPIVSSGVIAIDANTHYILFRNNISDASQTYNNDISINYPSTDTDYHAYNGHTTTISWEDEVGTVYGGTLDVVSGVLTVDRVMVDMGSLNYTYYENNKRFAVRLDDGKPSGSAFGLNTALCECYPVVTSQYGSMVDSSISIGSNFFSSSTCALVIHDENYTDATLLKASLNGKKVVYELATPTTYQLSPTAVASILGLNNVWADTNGNTSLEYVRDATKTINDLIARVEALEG